MFQFGLGGFTLSYANFLAYLNNDDFDRARAVIEQGYALNARDPEILFVKATVVNYGYREMGKPGTESNRFILQALEINPELMRYAMGAGITTASATEESYSLGGDPAVTTCALHVRHEMLVGYTANYYLWKAEGRSDGMQNVFNLSPTTFPMKFRPSPWSRGAPGTSSGRWWATG